MRNLSAAALQFVFLEHGGDSALFAKKLGVCGKRNEAENIHV